MPKSSKAIRKRIKSVTSTKKITRTMEMVATSKLQRTQGRVLNSRPYMRALGTLMQALSGAVEALGLSALFERREPVKRVLVFLVTSNRGLCGGYNSNLVAKARAHLDALREQGILPVLHVAGKKGIAAMRFAEVPVASARTDLPARPTIDEARSVGAPLLQAFLDVEVDRVDIVYADFRSASQQPPAVLTLLPIGGPALEEPRAAVASTASVEYIFEPSPAGILAQLGAQFVQNTMYRVLLSSVASEQLARRVAMKNATDNANEMQRNLTREYNKARQAQITQEIAEIVGGAAALE